MQIVVQGTSFSPRFKREWKKLPPDVLEAAKKALRMLMANSAAGGGRCHTLSGHKPTIFVIDVFANKSWQITFEFDGTTADLKRIARHSQIDDAPR